MKIGLVGYQGSGKSTLFQLLTGIEPDVSKAHLGQVGIMTVIDERFRKLVEMHQPKKESPSKIELRQQILDGHDLIRQELHGEEAAS